MTRLVGATGGGAAGPMKVLVVDDEADYRYLVGVGLGILGHAVEEADDGEAACRVASEFRPDIILIDYVLVGENGLRLLPKLRHASPGSALVLHTVEREHTTPYVGHPAGPDGLVEKGQAPSELATALEGILTYHWARSSSGDLGPARPPS
jgi:DNA-binding response OmpR family regulator